MNLQSGDFEFHRSGSQSNTWQRVHTNNFTSIGGSKGLWEDSSESPTSFKNSETPIKVENYKLPISISVILERGEDVPHCRDSQWRKGTGVWRSILKGQKEWIQGKREKKIGKSKFVENSSWTHNYSCTLASLALECGVTSFPFFFRKLPKKPWKALGITAHHIPFLPQAISQSQDAAVTGIDKLWDDHEANSQHGSL